MDLKNFLKMALKFSIGLAIGFIVGLGTKPARPLSYHDIISVLCMEMMRSNCTIDFSTTIKIGYETKTVEEWCARLMDEQVPLDRTELEECEDRFMKGCCTS